MLEAIFNDVVGVMRGTFLSGDLTAIGIAVGAVLIAALMMQRGGQIGSMTLLALMLFVIGCIARALFGTPIAEGAAAGNRFVNQLEASYLEFSNLQAGTILAYFIAFMVVILLFFGLKSMLSRG